MPRYSISMIEIIYNPQLDPSHQFIDLYTYTFESLYNTNSTFNNQSMVSLATSDEGYLMLYQ
jgi:hypothetical protein